MNRNLMLLMMIVFFAVIRYAINLVNVIFRKLNITIYRIVIRHSCWSV